MVHRPPGLFPGRAWLSEGTPIRLTSSMDQGHTQPSSVGYHTVSTDPNDCNYGCILQINDHT